ncbi:MAG: hypothetical protein HKN29_00775 [Rhodothermales bacterium]|nr:hypothetical protein [Rhodothermales bacterium]
MSSLYPRQFAGVLIPLGLVLLLLSGCNRGPTPLVDVETLAVVGSQEISDSWFERTYVDFLIRTGQNDTESNRRAHLENLIDAVLLAEEAERAGLTADSAFQVFRDRERKKALGTVFFHEELLLELPPPTDAEVRLAFARWKAQVVVRHLFFQSEEDALASYNRLRAGKDFLQEAQEWYGVPGDSSAGYLGPVKYFEMDDAFAEAAFNLEEGAFSRPVQSRFGWHIIRSERILVNPLLTEDEYQVRRGGIESQFRLRRRKLEGDAFVRDFMAGLDVEANGPAIAGLAGLIDDLTIEVAPEIEIQGAEEVARAAVLDSLKAMISAETVLATYRLGGRQREFTAGDYLLWMEDLPFEVTRRRTVNSVGRALRNEVFAQEAERKGLEDEIAEGLVWEASTLRLAGMMRNKLRENPGTVSDSMLAVAAERAGWFARAVRMADADTVGMRRALAPIVAEYRLIDSLRASTTIEVDTLRYQQLQEGLNAVPDLGR